MNDNEVITLAHGNGGKLSHQLINDIFVNSFSNEIILDQGDAACVSLNSPNIAITTDSFVIDPIFFRGGDIGKLSICGTVNDLVASGAKPLYITCAFIIEEGFKISKLQRIVYSMKETAALCGVSIVGGDTKVVQSGAADKIFITTSGVGEIYDGRSISCSKAIPGDKILITGTIADHGCSILLERTELNIASNNIKSDCAPLYNLIERAFSVTKNIHSMRDPTRGGVATVLNEIAISSNVGIKIYENKIPICREVRSVCNLLGIDPLYMANEGKMIIVVPDGDAQKVLDVLKSTSLGKNSCIIGEVTESSPRTVIMETIAGGTRLVDMIFSDQLPRIC